MKDFDIGDLCTIKQPKLNIMAEKRIVTIEEVYENSFYNINIQFGDGYLVVSDYLKRKFR